MEENKKEIVKLNFLKRLKIAITDFDNYKLLAVEPIIKMLLFVFILVFILGLISSVPSYFKYKEKITNGISFINENVEEIEYKENKLSVTNLEPVEIKSENNLDFMAIVDTSDEAQVDKHLEKLKEYKFGIVILNDKYIYQTNVENKVISNLYSNLNQGNMLPEIANKSEAIDFMNENVNSLSIAMYLLTVLIFIIDQVTTILMFAVMLACFGWMMSVMYGVKLKSLAIYKMAVYAFTLPMILNAMYLIILTTTGFVIEYFFVMYLLIATIYLIAAILMIRSDLIKQQIEISVIVEKQKEIREELAKEEKEKQEENDKKELKEDETEEDEVEKEVKSKKDNKNSKEDLKELPDS